MKIPKCPKTITRKHKWFAPTWYISEDPLQGKPRCIYCGLIDDRKKKI